MDTGPMPLSHRESAEVFSVETRLMTVDLSAPHLPDAYDVYGVKLCSTHGEVYSKLRGTLMCDEKDFKLADGADHVFPTVQKGPEK